MSCLPFFPPVLINVGMQGFPKTMLMWGKMSDRHFVKNKFLVTQVFFFQYLHLTLFALIFDEQTALYSGGDGEN